MASPPERRRSTVTSLALFCGAWGVLSGCAPTPCEGPGCEEEYEAAQVSLLLGNADGWPEEVDPIEDAAYSLVGSAAEGGDWSALPLWRQVYVGMPEPEAVHRHVWKTLEDETEATASTGVVRDMDDGTGFGTALATTTTPEGDVLWVAAPAAAGWEDAPRGGRLYGFPITGGLSGELDPAAATVQILGEASYDRFGTPLTPCADFDGDGHAELAVGALWDEAGGGELGGSITIIRSGDLWDAPESERTDGLLRSSTGTVLTSGMDGALAGSSVLCRDDFTGDGIADIVVGAPYADDEEAGVEAAGAAYVLEWEQVREGGDLELLATWRLRGPSEESYLGYALAAADLDDPVPEEPDATDPAPQIPAEEEGASPELLVGSPGTSDGQGRVQVYDTSLGVEQEPTPRFRIRGEAEGDRFGSRMVTADLNGDGYLDILVGAPRHNPTGDASSFSAGALYVWYGSEVLASWEKLLRAEEAHTRIFRAQGYLSTGARFHVHDVSGDDYPDLVSIHSLDLD